MHAADVEQVLHIDRDFGIRSDVEIAADARIHAQSFQAGIRITVEVELQRIGPFIEQLPDREARIAGSVRIGIAIKRDARCCSEMHSRARSCAARVDPEKAELCGDFEVRHIEQNVALKPRIGDPELHSGLHDEVRVRERLGRDDIQFDRSRIDDATDAVERAVDRQEAELHVRSEEVRCRRQRLAVLCDRRAAAFSDVAVDINEQRKSAFNTGVDRAL